MLLFNSQRDSEEIVVRRLLRRLERHFARAGTRGFKRNEMQFDDPDQPTMTKILATPDVSPKVTTPPPAPSANLAKPKSPPPPPRLSVPIAQVQVKPPAPPVSPPASTPQSQFESDLPPAPPAKKLEIVPPFVEKPATPPAPQVTPAASQITPPAPRPPEIAVVAESIEQQQPQQFEMLPMAEPEPEVDVSQIPAEAAHSQMAEVSFVAPEIHQEIPLSDLEKLQKEADDSTPPVSEQKRKKPKGKFVLNESKGVAQKSASPSMQQRPQSNLQNERSQDSALNSNIFTTPKSAKPFMFFRYFLFLLLIALAAAAAYLYFVSSGGQFTY